jgi:hypothetical protein
MRTKDVKPALLQEVYDLLISRDGALEFTTTNQTFGFKGEVLAWEAIFSECNKQRASLNLDERDYLILLTSKPNEDNWFSSFEPDGAPNIFIHTGDWDFYIPCNPKFAIAFQVIENLLQSLMSDTVEHFMSFVHEPPIGCMNDMCSWKQDITFKLRTADICSDCLEQLNKHGVSDAIIKQSLALMADLRPQFLFCRDHIINTDSSHADIPFPIAITRRKLSMAVDPLRKFLLLLDHFDSMIRTTVLLLGKVTYRDSFPAFLQSTGLNQRPSLGHWVAAFQKIVRDSSEMGNGTIPQDFINRLSSIVSIANENMIVNLRNEKRGHGYCDCHDSSYARVFQEYAPVINSIEKYLVPILRRLRCHYVISTDRTPAGQFEMRALKLMGEHPDFIEVIKEFTPKGVDDIPSRGRVYVSYSNETQLYGLHPYLIYDQCPVCSHNRVLLTDGEQYLDPYAGHRVKIDV